MQEKIYKFQNINMQEKNCDSYKSPYFKVISNDNKFCGGDYNNYCNSQNSETTIFPKNNQTIKKLNSNSFQNSYNINYTTTARDSIPNNFEENDFNGGQNTIPNNFINILSEQSLQQESKTQVIHFIPVQSNNPHHQQTHKVSQSQKSKKKIFGFTNVKKENETIKSNIKEKKDEIPPHAMPKSKNTNLFKVEKPSKNDENELFTMRIILLALMYKDYINEGKGRIPNLLKELGFKGKSNRFSKKNLYNNILQYCKLSIDTTINNECRKYQVAFRKLTIKSQLDIGGFANYKTFCKKYLYDIYINSFPKHIKKSEKLEKAKDGINKENLSIIKYVITKEKYDKEAEIKKLNLLFKKTTFFIILEAFLENQNCIKVDNTPIELEGFKTFDYYLNDLNPEEKENLKKIFKKKLGMSNT